MTVDAPYRELAAAPLHRAVTRDGPVSLEVGPEHVRLELGARIRLTVAGCAATLVRRRSGGDRRSELALDGHRLWLARSFPTRDLALWYEPRPGRVERLAGVRPMAPFEKDALGAWHALDRVAEELGRALAPHAGGALEVVELGRGHHRVLLVELADRLVAYARPLFREQPRRALEVCRDGSLVLAGRRRDRRAQFESRAGVTVSGDRVCFSGSDGRECASLWLPWVALEDRQELARRFGELAFPAPPEPDYEPRTEPRAWVSGLDRKSVV